MYRGAHTRTLLLGAAFAMLLAIWPLAAGAQLTTTDEEDQPTPVIEAPLALQYQAYHVLGPGDHLQVNLYAHSDGMFDVVIDANGEITLREVGRVEIGGMRIDAAEKLVEGRFAEFYREPWVDMTLLHMGRQEVLVYGGLMTTELVEIDSGTTLFEVLKLINLNPFTSRRTSVIRGQFPLFNQISHENTGTDARESFLPVQREGLFGEDSEETMGMGALMNQNAWLDKLIEDPRILSFRVDAARLFVEGNLPQYNVELKHGDIIYLQAPEKQIRIEGTNRQGEFELLEGETMVDLLVLAGFITDSRSDLRNVVLDRSIDGEIQRAVFDMRPAGIDAAYLHDIELEDKDVIRIVQQMQQVFVMGEVNRPGVVQYRQNWTVFDYLAAAGGWTGQGHDKFIAIIHHPRDLHAPCLESDMCVVNWPKFYGQGVPTEYMIYPGDVIFVPPKGEKVTFGTVTSAINTLFLGINFFDSLSEGNTERPEPEPTDGTETLTAPMP